MAPRRSTPWELSTVLRDVPGRKDFGRPLAPFTSIRIGGPADTLVRIETVDALRCLQAVAREQAIPLFILGGGSNLLIRDGGIRGIVVLLRGSFVLTKSNRVVPSQSQWWRMSMLGSATRCRAWRSN
jgi:hypothetical protein